MDAQIVAAQCDGWVRRYFPRWSALALPLAGKPLVEHQLDACARAGVASVRILDAAYDRRLARRLGDGSRWGLRLSYERAASAACAATAELAFHGPEFVYEGRRVRIESLRDYFEWNLRLVAEPRDCVLPGYASERGVTFGMNVRLRTGCATARPVLLGDNAWIGDDCRLGGSVIVGEGAVLDRGCRLQRVIVFPQTYVARDIELADKIVVGSRVIDPIAGACVHVTGEALVSDTRRVLRGVGWLFRVLRPTRRRHAD